MSDSDDTDILLLIPPNFFLTNTNLDESLNYDLFQSHLQTRTMENYSADKAMHYNSYSMNPCSKDSFSTPTSKSMIDQLKYQKYTNPSPNTSNTFTPNSKTSPISYGKPYAEQIRRKLSPAQYDKHSDDVVLDEIDDYLEKCHFDQSTNSFDKMKQQHDIRANIFSTPKQQLKPLQTEIVTNLSSKKMSEWDAGLQKSMNQNDQLISLANVWQQKEQTSEFSAEFEEEKLRRRQCERSNQNLQNQLQQCQSKYSDAIKMDQTKNEAMARLHSTNSR